MSFLIDQLALQALPAVDEKILCITLDANANGRIYDLSLVDLGEAWVKGGILFCKMIADVDFFYKFDNDTTSTLDQTSALAAGGTPNNAVSGGFTVNGCDLVAAKIAEFVRIDRVKQRYLRVKAGGAGTLRIRAVSQITNLTR